MTLSRLAKAAGAPKGEVESALHELQAEYRERGINLISNGGEWQFVTHPRAKEAVERFLSGELADELSRAGLEVLAIIAYQGPVSHAAIDYIRGVDSSFSLRNLLIRGLVTREENPKDRRSYLYRISTEFLKHVGLTRLEELPNYDTLRAEKVEARTGEADQR